MRTVAAALAVVVLAGCATRTLEQEIAAASHLDLCEVFLYGTPQMTETVRPEVFRRGLNCRGDYDAAILHRQQLRAISAGRPAATYTPYQIPMPAPMGSSRTTCATQRIGDQLQTVCR